jgi:hypothetical protein
MGVRHLGRRSVAPTSPCFRIDFLKHPAERISELFKN